MEKENLIVTETYNKDSKIAYLCKLCLKKHTLSIYESYEEFKTHIKIHHRDWIKKYTYHYKPAYVIINLFMGDEQFKPYILNQLYGKFAKTKNL